MFRNLAARSAIGLWPTLALALLHAGPSLANPPTTVLARAQVSGVACPRVSISRLDEGGAALGVAASAAVNATSPMDCSEPYVNIAWDAYANARVDLARGELHAVAYASSTHDVLGTAANAGATALFLDTLYLQGSGSGVVTLGIDVDGMADATGTAVYGVSVCFGVSLGDAFPDYTCRRLDNYRQGNVFVGVPGHEEIDWLLRTTIGVTPLPVNLYASIDVGANDGSTGGRAVLDLGHTAHLRVQLPEGVSFTSQSGVLLTQPASPVPEPSAALLAVILGGFGMLLGVGVLLAKRRRRDG